MTTGSILTASRAIEHARYTYGGASYEFPGHVDPLGLVNEAGDYLVSMNDWQWLTGASATLDFKANTDTVKLPADFKSLVWQDHQNGLVSTLTMVSDAEFLELQTSGISGNIEYYGHIVWERPASGGHPVPKIQVWPTPGAAEDDVLRISYEAGWRYVAEASEALTLPPWLTTLYLEILVHITRGRLEEDQGTASARLQGLGQSELYRAAVRRDASAQREMGPMRRTHVSSQSALGAIWPDDWGYVQGPS